MDAKTTSVKDTEQKFGVAFSGGGIRSAAFCSGVLRSLISQDKEPDVLSCVSGGGYTGSAYVQWKYFKNGQDSKEWADEFFQNMETNVGLFCNWSKGFGTVCWDIICLLSLVFFVILVSCFSIFAFAFPIALLVKILYGRFLDGTLCRTDAGSVDCIERKLLFFLSFLIFILFHVVDYYCNFKKLKSFFKLGQLIFGNTFAFTFFPWFINDFVKYMAWWEIFLIICVTALFWFFVPVLRKYSSLVLIIYIYSYVVYWHVYKGTMIVLKYTDARFKICMTASVIILAVLAVFGDLKHRTVYLYNR